jgi:hypothetical protein
MPGYYLSMVLSLKNFGSQVSCGFHDWYSRGTIHVTMFCRVLNTVLSTPDWKEILCEWFGCSSVFIPSLFAAA